ncbi:MAG TPA: cob(I)yrinic acid a,c-diamide adenosyltransferase [Verrucomicrobiae bacterium]|nr:cob(I)yrinic acid a,c-diamide adenosyltransferase [Verrucomicrobiae bacterium]
MPRLTKIYTRTGDQGHTGLVGGQRVSKDSPRIWAFGTVDELNSAIGLARAFNAGRKNTVSLKLDKLLAQMQNELFDLGAELATTAAKFRTGMPRIGKQHIASLERVIDGFNAELGPLQEFVVPGGSQTAAALHLARTICRRAERFCVRLAREEKIGEQVVPYLNRLSDALFVLARWTNRQQRVAESLWKK